MNTIPPNILPASHPFNQRAAAAAAAKTTPPVISGATPPSTVPAPAAQTKSYGNMAGKLVSGAYSCGVYLLSQAASHAGVKTAAGAAGAAVGYMLTESYAGPLAGAAIGAVLPVVTSAAYRVLKGTPSDLTDLKRDAGLDDADMEELDQRAWSAKMQASDSGHRTALIEALNVLKTGTLLKKK